MCIGHSGAAVKRFVFVPRRQVASHWHGRCVFVRHAATRREQEGFMASGKADKAKGRMEKAVGDLTDDPQRRRRGQDDEAAGKLKDTIERGIDNARGKK